MIQRTTESGAAQVRHRHGLLQTQLFNQLAQPELAFVAPSVEITGQDHRPLMAAHQRGQIVELLAEGGHPQFEVDRMEVDHQHAVRIALQRIEAHQPGFGDAQQGFGGAHATDERLRGLGHRHHPERHAALGEGLQLLPLEITGAQPVEHLGTGGRLLQQHQILPLGVAVHPLAPVLALSLVEVPDRDAEFTGQRRGRQRHQRRTLAVDTRHNPIGRDQMVLIRHLETAYQPQGQQGGAKNAITIFHRLTTARLCFVS